MNFEFVTKDDLNGLQKAVEKMKEQLHQISPLTTGDLLNDNDLQRLFKVSGRTIKNWRGQGKLEFIKVGSVVFTTKEAVQNFINKHKVKSNYENQEY
ncbi:MAG: helix-turn-helix domain-containing protein [Bacteroidia bacterium]